jgi:hypothetical protein
MAVHFSCPKCANHITLSDDWAGKRVRCRCGELVQALPERAIQEGTSRPPTPHLDAAALRPQPRRHHDREQDSESVLPWILAGVGVLVVLFLLGGGMLLWALRASDVTTFPEDGAPHPVIHGHDPMPEKGNGNPLPPDPRPPEQPKEPDR